MTGGSRTRRDQRGGVDAAVTRRIQEQLTPRIRRSWLMERGGYDVFEGLVDDSTHRLLQAEAMGLVHTAELTDAASPCDEEIQGGNPPRRFFSAPGGAVLDALYGSEWVNDLLQRVTGGPVCPTGSRGTYTYYARAGDYLAIHRDEPGCDVVVITLVYEKPAVQERAGALCLYPDRLCEPLSAIRATPDTGAIFLRLEPMQSLVMYGGVVPHQLLRVLEGQFRTVAVLCFRLL
jgi:hypothetical protein